MKREAGNVVAVLSDAPPYKRIALHASDQDTSLSWKALGILTYLLTRPRGWNLRRSDLVARKSDGKSAVKSGLAELEEAGYLRKVPRQRDDGYLDGYLWIVRDTPLPEEEWGPVINRALRGPR